jgi:hypothetical protein
MIGRQTTQYKEKGKKTDNLGWIERQENQTTQNRQKGKKTSIYE